MIAFFRRNPLALFLPSGHPLRMLTLILAGAQLLSFTFVGQAHVLNYLVMTLLPALGWWLWSLQTGALVLKSPVIRHHEYPGVE